MNFWDTVLGHNLAEVLIRNLPRIADTLNNLQKPVKRNQRAKIVFAENVEKYLNEEFEQGRVFVSATQLEMRGTKTVLVITE